MVPLIGRTSIQKLICLIWVFLGGKLFQDVSYSEYGPFDQKNFHTKSDMSEMGIYFGKIVPRCVIPIGYVFQLK